MTGASPRTIAVAVPTYRRPDQLRTLLEALRAPIESASARVIVVDNDEAHSAREVVELCAESMDIQYLTEPRPGVVHARNAAIDAVCADDAEFDWLVFIDDDEQPCDGWLDALLETGMKHGASIVTGPVEPVFAEEPAQWIRDCGFFDPPRRPTGMTLRKAFTGNMMIAAEALRRTGIRFDERLSLSGGEDVLFSRQFAEAGELIVWCAEARVVERQPADRLTRAWIMNRAFRVGTTSAFVELAVRPRFAAWCVVMALGCYKMLKAAVFYPLLGWLGASHRAMYQHLWTYGRGMLRGLTGHVHAEYARTSESKSVGSSAED